MTQLDNAVVVITGAAGGFGLELTRQLLAIGSRLILTDLDITLLKERTASLPQTSSTGEILAYIAADLSTREGCEALYQQVQALNVPIDILINNAGIAVFGRMDEVPIDRWERLMAVNLLAPMRLSALFTPAMIARRTGHIVNISSLAGWISPPGLTHYSTSKFGLRGFSEGLASELKPYNVQVTVVYPFFSRTPILNAERFGTFARTQSSIPESWVTDPATVMQSTLEGIRRNCLHVFPDRAAQVLHRLQRYSPRLLNWINSVMTRTRPRGRD